MAVIKNDEKREVRQFHANFYAAKCRLILKIRQHWWASVDRDAELLSGWYPAHTPTAFCDQSILEQHTSSPVWSVTICIKSAVATDLICAGNAALISPGRI